MGFVEVVFHWVRCCVVNVHWPSLESTALPLRSMEGTSPESLGIALSAGTQTMVKRAGLIQHHCVRGHVSFGQGLEL